MSDYEVYEAKRTTINLVSWKLDNWILQCIRGACNSLAWHRLCDSHQDWRLFGIYCNSIYKVYIFNAVCWHIEKYKQNISYTFFRFQDPKKPASPERMHIYGFAKVVLSIKLTLRRLCLFLIERKRGKSKPIFFQTAENFETVMQIASLAQMWMP